MQKMELLRSLFKALMGLSGCRAAGTDRKTRCLSGPKKEAGLQELRTGLDDTHNGDISLTIYIAPEDPKIPWGARNIVPRKGCRLVLLSLFPSRRSTSHLVPRTSPHSKQTQLHTQLRPL